MARLTIALAIAGIGDSTLKTGGIAWAFGDLPSAAQQAASAREWQGGVGSSRGLVSIPKTVTTEAEPYDASMNVSAGAFELHLDDFTAEKLLFKQSTTELYLTAPETASTDSIGISGPGNTVLAGLPIWVGAECIGLGVHTGGGVYTGCVRGLWGSPATRHRAGVFVYATAPPFFRTREAWIVLYDRDTGTEEERWSGWLTVAPSSNGNGTKLRIRTEERWSSTFRAEINRGAPDLSRQSSPVYLTKGADGVRAQTRTINPTPEPRVAKNNQATPYRQSMQLETALFYARWGSASAQDIRFRNERAYGSSSDAIEFDDDQTTRLAKPPLFEVFAVARDLDQDGDTDRHGSVDSFFSATRQLTLPFHPLSIAFALLTSTYDDNFTVGTEAWDALGGDWGLAIPTDWIDTAAVAAVIDRTRSAKVDRLTLGWDGKRVKVWDVIRDKLLQPFGFFFGTNENGKLTAATLKAMDVGDVATAQKVDLLPFELQMLEDPSDGINTVYAQIGGTPWDEGRSDAVFALDAVNDIAPGDSLRTALFSQRAAIEIDYEARTDFDGVRNELLIRAKRGRFAAPRLMIKVGAGDYPIGGYIAPNPTTLRRPWFVDPLTGKRVRIVADDPRFMGQTIARRWDTPRNTYILTIRLANYRSGGKFSRLVSPAMEITSVSTTNVANDTMNCAATSQFGFGAADSTSFTSASTKTPRVEVWKPDGTRRSAESRPLDLAQATSILLGEAFTTTPQAGDIVRLAHLDDVNGFPEDGDDTFVGFLAWVFMADASGELGPNDLDGHVYGDGLY